MQLFDSSCHSVLSPGKTAVRKRDATFFFPVVYISGETYMNTVSGTVNSNPTGSTHECSDNLGHFSELHYCYPKISFMNECLFAKTLTLSREGKI